jgi:hypothetical protein
MKGLLQRKASGEAAVVPAVVEAELERWLAHGLIAPAASSAQVRIMESNYSTQSKRRRE